MNKLSKYKIHIVLVVALVVRLIAISQSLWLDEAIGALVVRDYSYSEIITDFLRSDNHPPLFYLDLKSWTSILGYSEFALRLPSVIYGVLTVYLTFLIASKISRRKEGLIPITSALLLATSPFHIYYSQEARMYSLAAFLASLAIYSFLHLIDKKVEIVHWVLFSLAITMLVFTDYVPVFLLPVFWIYALLKGFDRKWWVKFTLVHSLLVMVGILWLPTLIIQAEKGRWLMSTIPAWRQVAGGANFKQAALVWMKFVLGRITFLNKRLYYSLIVVASVPIVITLALALKRRARVLLVWLWLVVPLMLGFIVSYWFPAFIYFRFLFVVPAFYVLLANGVSMTKKMKQKYLLIIILLINILGFMKYVFDPQQHRENWRQAVRFVESRVEESEVVLFSYPQPFSPYRWYARKSHLAHGATDSISADPELTKNNVEKIVSSKKGVYYFEYLKDLSDPQSIVQNTIINQGFVETAIHDFPGVGLLYYYVYENI